MVPIKLFDYQKDAVEQLESGKILVGGVGTGKSFTSLNWWFCKVCGGQIEPDYKPMSNPKTLYIITTAKKRDDCEWDNDLAPFRISTFDENPIVIVDSWNNIKKYVEIKDAVFIFDEQRLVGSGTWVKSFYKIAKNNKWILLTATPGDTFKDYIPVFVANGFYRNKTDFENQHVEWDRFAHFPKYKKYHNTGKLIKFQRDILVQMEVPDTLRGPVRRHHEFIKCDYNEAMTKTAIKSRWDPYKNEPMQQASVLCYVLRRITNEDISRLEAVKRILSYTPKAIIFYNFDYELDMLRAFLESEEIPYTEWNGHRHDDILPRNRWAYLVQYTAGNEGWNCVTCDTIIFYSQNYSYKIMVQAAGRIDRLNTPFKDLYYYHLYSESIIDRSIKQAVSRKKKFNEKVFASVLSR